MLKSKSLRTVLENSVFGCHAVSYGAPKRAVCIRNVSDFSPFGVSLDGRTIQSDFYRLGFNGKEKDDELKGMGNSYDFGARIYDSRVARFLSIDPKYKKFPTFSNYSYASNSPILFIDLQGEDPKVAVLFYKGDVEAFDTHKVALEKAGFTVVRATNGEELLKLLGEHSSPESPIEQLVIISHGSQGGPEMTSGAGNFWTNSELNKFAKEEWVEDKMNQLAKIAGTDIENTSSENFDIRMKNFIRGYANDKADEFWNNKNLKNKFLKTYKSKHKTIEVNDFVNAINSGKIYFSDNWTAVFTGCNISGYLEDDGQVIFAGEFAKKTKSTVFAAKGTTGPIFGTALRIANKSYDVLDYKGFWFKTTPDVKTNKLSSKINITNPK